MSILGDLVRVGRKRASPENPSTNLSNPDDWLIDAWNGTPAATGRRVSPFGAMQLTAVYASVRLIAETLSTLPIAVYRKVGRTREQQDEHPVSQILRFPNPQISGTMTRESTWGFAALTGNGFMEIARDQRNRPQELWPVRGDRVFPRRIDGKLVYQISIGSDIELVPADRMIHVMGYSYDGLTGVSPIGQAKQTVALGQAAEEFGARFFGNGTNPSGVLTYPEKLDEETYEQIRNRWEKNAGTGLSGAQRTAILEMGLDWKQISIPPEQAQFLQTRKYTVTDIARLFRVPPHMIGDLERATFSNIEHQQIGFLIFSLRPWLVRIEDELTRKLLSPAERADGYFIRHNVEGLLRGDTKSRFESFAIGRQWGWYSINDVREMEDLPGIGPEGDEYLSPMNMAPAGEEEVGQPAGAGPGGGPDAGGDERSRPVKWTEVQPGVSVRVGPSGCRSIAAETRSLDSRRSIQQAALATLRDAGERVTRREVDRIRKLLDQTNDLGEVLALIERYHRESHLAYTEKTIAPPVELVAASVRSAVESEMDGRSTKQVDDGAYRQFLAALVAGMAAKWVSSSIGQIRDLTKGQDDWRGLLDQRLAEWAEKRPDKFSRGAAVQSTQAMSREAYSQLGVERLVWKRGGSDDCEICPKLEGRVVAISEPFLSEEMVVETEGRPPLRSYGRVHHPPAHPGCVCQVSPA